MIAGINARTVNGSGEITPDGIPEDVPPEHP
jgi:hypothetical protein